MNFLKYVALKFKLVSSAPKSKMPKYANWLAISVLYALFVISF